MSHFDSCSDNLSTIISLSMVIIAFPFTLHIKYLSGVNLFIFPSFIFCNFLFFAKIPPLNCLIILLSLMGIQKKPLPICLNLYLVSRLLIKSSVG